MSDLSEEASSEPDVTFEGHTSLLLKKSFIQLKCLFKKIFILGEVTCLSWDSSESQVASGSKDSRVIVWDVVSETGLHKLSGHKGVITRVRFWQCRDEEFLVTSSYDTTLRIWNLATKLNVHSIPCTIQVS